MKERRVGQSQYGIRRERAKSEQDIDSAPACFKSEKMAGDSISFSTRQKKTQKQSTEIVDIGKLTYLVKMYCV